MVSRCYSCRSFVSFLLANAPTLHSTIHGTSVAQLDVGLPLLTAVRLPLPSSMWDFRCPARCGTSVAHRCETSCCPARRGTYFLLRGDWAYTCPSGGFINQKNIVLAAPNDAANGIRPSIVTVQACSRDCRLDLRLPIDFSDHL